MAKNCFNYVWVKLPKSLREEYNTVYGEIPSYLKVVVPFSNVDAMRVLNTLVYDKGACVRYVGKGTHSKSSHNNVYDRGLTVLGHKVAIGRLRSLDGWLAIIVSDNLTEEESLAVEKFLYAAYQPKYNDGSLLTYSIGQAGHKNNLRTGVPLASRNLVKGSVVHVNTGHTYTSSKDAALSLGLERNTVSAVVRGARQSTGGQVFIQADEWGRLSSAAQQKAQRVAQSLTASKSGGRPMRSIVELTTGTEYKSVNEASQSTGLNISTISCILSGKIDSSRGYVFVDTADFKSMSKKEIAAKLKVALKPRPMGRPPKNP